MTDVAVIDMREFSVTPYFKYMEIENIPKSETAGHAVMEMREVVEVRIAGRRDYSPVFPIDAMYRREGNKVITYAERWNDQYRAFKDGNMQEVAGTPLEMLIQHGITPELISLCRALKIYTIEALHILEGDALKSLRMNAGRLKDAARKFMADRELSRGSFSELEALRARVAELEGKSTDLAAEMAPVEVEAAIDAADEAYAAMSDGDIKDEIEKLSGVRPKGNPSRRTIESLLTGLLAA